MKNTADTKPVFRIVIPVLNQFEATERILESWFVLAKERVSVLFLDNGSDENLSEQPFIKRWSSLHDVKVHRNELNVGVYPTFKQGYELVGDCDFVFYSHSDLEMLEYCWDEKLICILNELKQVSQPGVCGMFGARGIGTPDIYKAPYVFTQLMRWSCIAVESMANTGEDVLKLPYERVTVLDGFSLIINSDFIKEVGFDHESYPPHHSYDNDICLASHFAGYRNYVIDVDCKHHGGITSTRENWNTRFGKTDLQIHRDSHVVLYEKYKGRLPVGVRGVI